MSSFSEDVVGAVMLRVQITHLNRMLQRHGVPLRAANDFGIGYRLTPT